MTNLTPSSEKLPLSPESQFSHLKMRGLELMLSWLPFSCNTPLINCMIIISKWFQTLQGLIAEFLYYNKE